MAEPRRDILVVIDRRQERAGSAHLRGRQLARLFAEVAPDYGRAARLVHRDEAPRDAIAIVNKTLLARRDQTALHELKAAGCLLLVDFLDRPVTAPEAALADGFLACSALQYRHLRAGWPDKPCIHLPHHADLDLGAVACQWDAFGCAYFGNLDNAAHLDAVRDAGLVTLVETLTGNKNNWFAQLPAFNLHYAFRPRALWRGAFKPFTKGFTAARCGAVVLVAACDEEATGLLGEDYPFRIPGDADAAAVIDMLQAMREGFGDRRWRLARRRMRRLRVISSAAYLRGLIRAYFFEEGPFASFLR
jgi:hypothetical protein